MSAPSFHEAFLLDQRLLQHEPELYTLEVKSPVGVALVLRSWFFADVLRRVRGSYQILLHGTWVDASQEQVESMIVTVAEAWFNRRLARLGTSAPSLQSRAEGARILELWQDKQYLQAFQLLLVIKSAPELDDGYIYCVQEPHWPSELFKIGETQDFEKRGYKVDSTLHLLIQISDRKVREQELISLLHRTPGVRLATGKEFFAGPKEAILGAVLRVGSSGKVVYSGTIQAQRERERRLIIQTFEDEVESGVGEADPRFWDRYRLKQKPADQRKRQVRYEDITADYNCQYDQVRHLLALVRTVVTKRRPIDFERGTRKLTEAVTKLKNLRVERNNLEQAVALDRSRSR
jgi:hypothetical protein